MRSSLGLGLIMAAGLATAPTQGQAANFLFDFNGPGVSGTLNIAYQPNPNTGPLPQTAPNPVDPIGSYVITGVTGVVNDAALGLSGAAVIGLAPLNRVSPEPTNLLAPNSFSLLPVANGVQTPDGLSPGLHYDNLFYPMGSPQTATNYPFGGGVLDIYGVVFAIAGGDAVNFWSNGNAPPDGLNYGFAVTDGIDVRDYTGGVSITAVPEPASWATMLLGFGLVGTAARRRRRRIAFG